MPGNALWRVVRHSTRWGAGVLAAVTAIAAASCTNGGATDPTAPVTTGASAGPITTGASAGPTSGAPGGIPAADVAAIRASIDAINATAGGPVASQRAELQRLVAPEQRAKQRDCPTAHSTLAFQPAYSDLRHTPDRAAGTTGPSAPDRSSPAPSPGPSPTVGSPPAGTGYLLPAFITIYTGSRITGTDLTTLHLWVSDGTARTGALCVS